MPAPIRLYNTLSRSIEDFVPQQPGKIGLYVCGMTVYDRCHVGHARAMVVFDAFVRYLRYRGWDVNFVRNFTDIDDKIIARANELGEDPAALAQRYIDAFHEDAENMGLIEPDSEPRVSTSIDAIQTMIATLIEKGKAYENEGSVWYSVPDFSDYGKLSGQKVDELRSADEVPGKRHPADFALWKAVKPGEPDWPSPWGPGRPGWHIECSAMCCSELGPTIDIHGGGLDLVFPHHENEIAQSEDVLREYPAEVLRLYYLQSCYRSSLPWNADALPEALCMTCRLYEAREVAESMGGQEKAEQVAKDLGEDAQRVLDLSTAFEAEWLGSLDHDFNTAKGMAALFELVRAVNRFSNHKKARKRGGPVVAKALECFQVVSDSVGLLSQDVASFMEEVKTKRLTAMGVSRSEIEDLLVARTNARASKDWAEADRIRDTLLEKSIVIMDRPEGVDWRVRVGA
jgi:cysteinyl-tRNA synthetase